ncbi:MAG: CHAD domain-containing protein [Blastocatellia bacterium]
MVTNEIPASLTVDSVDQLAKTVFTDLHRTIVSHEAGAGAGEVEAVHDMRVAIRRLRVALVNFAVCLPREDRKRLRVRLENLAKALGGVRDLDVMIAALESNLLTRLGEDRPAISAWMRRLKSRRRARLRQLTEYLRGDEYAAFRREFSTEAQPLEQQSHGQAA